MFALAFALAFAFASAAASTSGRRGPALPAGTATSASILDNPGHDCAPVSYTHLDVYKRQAYQHEGDIAEGARRHMAMAAGIATGDEAAAIQGADSLMDYLEMFTRKVIDA